MADRPRRRLIGPGAIAALVAACLAALWLLRPHRQQEIQEEAAVHDPLALAYLEAAVQHDPTNAELRLRLVRAQLANGMLEQAERTLAPLLGGQAAPPVTPQAATPPAPTPARPDASAAPRPHARAWSPSRAALAALATAIGVAYAAEPPAARDDVLVLAFDVAHAQWRATAAGTPAHAAAEQKALERLQAALAATTSPAALAHLASAALELRRVDLAADVHERLATIEPRRCGEWLAAAARDQLAAAAPAKAAERFVRAQACEQDAVAARALGREAVKAHLAADQGGAALQLVSRLVESDPGDEQLLREAERIAIAQGDTAAARRFGALLLLRGTNDPDVLERQVALAVAGNDRGGALAAAQRVADLQPGNVAAHVRVAELASWAGEPRLALREWLRLSRRGEPRDAGSKALDLAHAVGDQKAAIEVLERQSESAPLAAPALQELEGAVEAVEGPGAAAAMLRRQVARHPGDRLARERLAAAQERQRDLEGAVATRRELAARFGPSIDASLRIAQLEWELGRPGAALRELERWSASGQGDASYWSMVGNLAWDREQDDALALRAYRKLWDDGKIDALGAERLVLLTKASGRHDEVIRLGAEAWARTRQPRVLLLAMDEAVGAGNWAALRELTDTARGSEPAFASAPEYWLVRGRLEEHERRTADAAASYRRALSVEPKSSTARAALIWLYGGAHDRRGLTECIAAWGKDAWNDATLRPAVAAGLEELGRRDEALAYYERDARVGVEPGRVRRYALALERSGDRPAAYDVSRWAAALDPGAGSAGLVGLHRGGPDLLPPAPAPDRMDRGAHLDRLQAEAGTETIGQLSSPHASVTVDSEAFGSNLRFRAARTSLQWASFPWDVGETLLQLRGAFPALGGRAELEAGGNLREAQSFPTAAAAYTHPVAPLTELRVEGSWNEPADESAEMRMEAVRTRAGASVTVSDGIAYGRLQGTWRTWSTRTGDSIGNGELAAAEIGARVFASRPDLRVRLQGSYQRNTLASDTIVFPISGVVSDPTRLVPAELTMVTAGVATGRWHLAGPLAVSGDFWMGGMAPSLRAAYRAEVTLWLGGVLGSDLSVTGYSGNDNWGAGGIHGVSVALSRRFTRE